MRHQIVAPPPRDHLIEHWCLDLTCRKCSWRRDFFNIGFSATTTPPNKALNDCARDCRIAPTSPRRFTWLVRLKENWMKAVSTPMKLLRLIRVIAYCEWKLHGCARQREIFPRH